jgi:hypothetical protein
MAFAAVPPLAAHVISSDAGGSFRLPLPDPEDPRLWLHIQAEHPDCAPLVVLLKARDGAAGFWREVEVLPDEAAAAELSSVDIGEDAESLDLRLRRALTVPVRIAVRDGSPLAHVAVRVTPRRDGHSFLDAPAELAANGRLVSRTHPRVLFADSEGVLRLPLSPYAYDLDLLHPELYLRADGSEAAGSAVSLLLPSHGGVALEADTGWIERFELVDAVGAPIGSAEVEVALDGMTALRVLTDEGGWIQLGILPFPRGEEPLGYRNPRVGTLTVLSPQYHQRSVRVALPSAEKRVVVNARPAPALGLRLMEGALPGNPPGEASGAAGAEARPISPLSLAASLDMTLVRLGRDGRLKFWGALPAPGAEFEVSTRGFLSRSVRIPDPGLPPFAVDLGDVALEAGLARDVVLAGASEAALSGARLFVSFEGGFATQRYAVGPSGRLRVRGLRPGPHRFSVQGPRLGAYSAVRDVIETEPDAPIELAVALSDEEEVVVSGRVTGVLPLDAAGFSVVERFTLRGLDDPLVFPPYPLAPDGGFGSVRRLRGAEAVEVAVVSTARKAVVESIGAGPPVFHLGELPLRQPPYAELTFFAEDLGRVDPPLQVAIEGPHGAGAAARLRIEDRTLFADNLRRGLYRLRWRSGADGEEAFLLDVDHKFGGKTTARVRRRALDLEAVEVRVSDSGGAPVTAALVLPPVGPRPAPLRPLDPGVRLAAVRPRERSEFRVAADGFLTTAVSVEPGELVPQEVTLYRGVAAFGRILDTDGLEFDGPLSVSWESESPSPFAYGKPLTVLARRGRFHVAGLPSAELVFSFRPEGSSATARRTLLLPETDQPYDLGDLRLGETRSLRGQVLRPDGAPAAGAQVALVPRARAYRFPLEEPLDLSRAAHRTKCDAQGGFRLEGLPVELPQDLVLVGRLAGFTDALDDLLDFAASQHVLVLRPHTALELEVGYTERGRSDDYFFSLEYLSDPADPGSRRDLGEVLPHAQGLHAYEGVEPGLYRVRWGLREAYEPFPGVSQEVWLAPGSSVRLRLWIDGSALRGRARLNGEALKRGWILLTSDPGLAGDLHVGRVRDGEFVLVDPPRTFHAYAAVVPEAAPQAVQNSIRGEALPRLVRDWRGAVRQGFLEFDYEARNLTVRFDPDFLRRHPGAVVVFDHYEWDGARFRAYAASEPIESQVLRLHLLEPSVRQVSVRSPRDSLIASYSVSLRREDVTLDVR